MAMPRNGWRSSRSRSQVRIASALPETATSRNLSSFGSRQARMGGGDSISVVDLRIWRKMPMRWAALTNLSSLGRPRTSASSVRVPRETRTKASCSALRTAWQDMEVVWRHRLTKTFVSITSRRNFRSGIESVLLVGQNLFEYLFRQAICASLIARDLAQTIELVPLVSPPLLILLGGKSGSQALFFALHGIDEFHASLILLGFGDRPHLSSISLTTILKAVLRIGCRTRPASAVNAHSR